LRAEETVELAADREVFVKPDEGLAIQIGGMR
jgi:hypothetical protein